MSADLLIALGPRSILSLIGIIILIAGVWYTDRTWDEKGSEAYAKAKKNTPDGKDVVIPKEDLDAAFPFPVAFIVGWALFGLSYLFPTSGEFVIQPEPASIAALIFSLALAVIASVPMGNAVRNRNADQKKKLSMAFVLSWVLLTISSGISADNGAVSVILCIAGMISIIASMKVLWKHRKMGDSWEQEGKPNPNPVVYNMGGPLFVFGWFMFWVGMASSASPTTDVGLPFYFDLRTALAFFAGCGMVPIVMMVDYAHDEGGKYVGFGTDGSYFGRFFESPIPFLTMWVTFGVSNFILRDGSFDTETVNHWIILAICAAQGITAGLLIQTALYEGDMARKNRWSVLFVLLFVSLAIMLSLGDGISRYLALPGAILVIAGQKTVFVNRKRGDYFMINHANNPNPVVYSVGEPLFMTGWILLSLAIALAV